MALQKQPISLNFGQGLDTKSDPNQVQVGKFLALQNSIFDKTGALVKRNGFDILTVLPDTSQTTLTTFNNNLIATGSSLYAFSQDTNQWFNQGLIQPVQLNTLSLLKVSTSQSCVDSSTASNGLVCYVYTDTSLNYYQLSDSKTGQQIVGRTALPSTATNPRVFANGNYFVITFIATVSGAPKLQYIAIPISMPTSPTVATTISADVRTLTSGYDGCVYATSNTLYLTWEGASTNINVTYLTAQLNIYPPINTFSLGSAHWDVMAITVDAIEPTHAVWITAWDSVSGFIRALALPTNLIGPAIVSTNVLSTTPLYRMTIAANGSLGLFYETSTTYITPSVTSHLVDRWLIDLTGSTTNEGPLLLSVGLASKAFLFNGTIYMLVTYGETPNQPTYFLVDGNGTIIMRLAYSNGFGYLTTQVLPNITLVNGTFYAPYLVKDFLASVNKGTNLPANTPQNGIYTQTGIDLAEFMINNNNQLSSNIANNLYLTGGILWQYDGVKPVEQGFNLWPEGAQVSTSGAGGSISANTYFYVFTYEWTDNQGNLNRSAPSIPIEIVTSGATSTNTLYVPTLRLTAKGGSNPVRIVGYRWSLTQQVYYQFTSITAPIINNKAIDFVTFTDTLNDTSILGNVLLYTTGGIVENIVPPATAITVLFNNRLFLVDAEDQNLLWFSKQVLEATPVELSDLFTIYVAPTTGAQGSTGPMTALFAMDDKLIIFKKDAIYYITGNGPDNTGANNDFSNAIYITSSVGCANQNSIVLMPQGLMFQSDKGIWLLGRDLSTNYIGAPVEQYNSLLVKSASVIPGTNQVRFVLNNSTTLVYDYYQAQWGTFSNISAISSTLYQGLQTYLNSFGQVFQEAPGTFTDGGTPVLMSFTSAWISAAGLQGYERFYFMFLLGTYFTPFKLNVQLAYDYNSSPSQNIIVSPDNFNPGWGGGSLWGDGDAYPPIPNPFKARLFPEKEKCETFQISINEVYDSTLGVQPGQGLSLSGMNLIIGVKKGYRTQSASRSFG